MSDTSQSAESRCICGKVRLEFLRPSPVLHVHCCCSDCRQGREWIASKGGPPVTQAVTMVYYFENDLAQVDPEALSLLFTVKLRENGRTTRLVTKCCHSILAIDHPYYDQNVVSVHSDACDLVAPQIKPLCRIFTEGWDAAHDGEMPSTTASLEDSRPCGRGLPASSNTRSWNRRESSFRTLSPNCLRQRSLVCPRRFGYCPPLGTHEVDSHCLEYMIDPFTTIGSFFIGGYRFWLSDALFPLAHRCR